MKLTIVAILTCIVAVRASSVTLLYLQTGTCLLGAYAALIFTALGGAAIPPGLLVVPFSLLRTMREQGGMRIVLGRMSVPGAWLVGLALWGVVGAVLLPRIFAGVVDVVRPDHAAGGITLLKLKPTSGNITQTAYVLGNVLTFVAVRGLIVSRERLVHAGKGVVLLAALMLAAGILNLVEHHGGLPSLLELTRTMKGVNSSYEARGFVRIQGTYAEASAYASRFVPLFAFCLTLWLHKRDEVFVGYVAMVSLAILMISTSGTAYASLGVYTALFGVRLVPTLLDYRRWPVTVTTLIGLCAMVLVLVALAWTLELQFTKDFSALLDRTLFGKMDTESGKERGGWNLAALRSFLDTYGLGVGLGSTYASSFMVVLASNLGLPGIILFGGFLRSVFQPLQPPLNPEQVPFVLAARQAVIASLIATSFSATVFNIGIQFYIYAAIASVDPRNLREV